MSDEYRVKLLMLGDSAVGKSSLLVRFCEDRFDSNFVLTIGIDFKWRTVPRNGKTLKLQIWDTAGQERFRTITPAYYKAAMGVVIVYDITDRVSYGNVENWIQQIDQQGDEAVRKILVGNKSDLDSNLRKVTSEEGEALAAKYNMRFFETSAKSGNGVDNAFFSIADEVVERRYGQTGGAAKTQPGQKVKLGNDSKPKSSGCCKK